MQRKFTFVSFEFSFVHVSRIFIITGPKGTGCHCHVYDWDYRHLIYRYWLKSMLHVG